MKNKNEDDDEEKEKTLFVDRRIGMNFHSFIHFTDHFQKKNIHLYRSLTTTIFVYN